MTIARDFADFAAGLESAPDPVLRAATRCLLDWWGGAIAGSGIAPATVLRAALTPAGGPARLLPGGASADPRTAALINGTASHTVEVDDIYSPGLYHPGVVVIPAALAAAEAEGASGRELLLGIIAGYEVSNRIARTVNPAHYKFWHSTATIGFFGAAAAAGRVLRLDAEQLAHALTSAASFAAGLRHAFSSDAMTKPMHAGRAAEGGLLAAMGARAGLTGVGDMLEGARGFGTAMSDSPDWSQAAATLGEEWTILRMTCKPYPCCGHCFAAIDATAAIMAGGIAADEIERIDIGTYRAGVEICGNADPRTPYEAKFSLSYCAALAALGRAVDLAAFAPERLHDPEHRAMMARVSVATDPEAEGVFPSLRAAVATVTTRDGRTETFRQPTRRGDPDFPLDDAAVEAKFLMLAAPVIGEGPARDLAAALRKIGTAESLSDVPAPPPV